MSTHVFTTSAGRKLKVNSPPGEEWDRSRAREFLQEQLRAQQDAQALRAYNDRQMTHLAAPPTTGDFLRQEAAKTFGVEPGQVDFSKPAVGPVMRLGEGLATDTPAEAANVYRGLLPGRTEQIGEFIATQPPGSSQVQFTNLPGMDWGDVAQTVGGAAVPVALGLAAGRAPLKTHALIQGGYELAKEAGQKLLGYQEETPGSYLTRTGLAAAGEGIPAIGRGLGKLKSFFGRSKQGFDLNEAELQEALSAVDDFSLPALMNYQKSKNPVVRRLADQVLQLTDEQRPQAVNQLQGMKDAYENYMGTMIATESLPPGQMGPPRPLSPDYLLQKQKAAEYEQRRAMLRPTARPKEAGQAVMDLVKAPPKREAPTAPPGGLDVRKKRMGDAYRKLSQIAKEEKPVFDIARSKKAAGPRQVLGEGLPQQIPGAIVDEAGKPLTVQTIQDEMVNVASDSPVRLQMVRNYLNRLDDTQTNFDVIKELRRQLGRYYEQSPVKLAESSVDKAAVDRLYGTLTDDMVPTNADQTPQFMQQRGVAEDLSRRYHRSFRMREVADVLSAMPQENPERLWRTLAGDPTTWSEAFTSVLREGNPEKLATLQKNLGDFVLQSPNPGATIERWRDQNPDALRFAFGSEEGIRQAEQIGRELVALDKGIGKQAFDAVTEQRGFALKALQDRLSNPNPNESPFQAASRLVGEVGGKTGKEGRALRNAALETVFRDALKINPKYDVPGLDPSAFSEGLAALEKNGWWEGVLTKKDRDVMKKLQAYSKRTWETGDTGTALTVASQVGKLRGGSGLSGMTEAFMSLRAAHVMSTFVTGTNTPKELLYDKLPFQIGRKTKDFVKSRPPMGQGKVVRGLRFLSRALRDDWEGEEESQRPPAQSSLRASPPQ